MAETVRLWTDRFSYSGEIPSNYPGLRPRAIARINEETSTLGGYTDGADSSREWYMQWDGSGSIWGRGDGPMGGRLQINGSGAATAQGRLQLDHFSGLWPSSDRRRVLVGLWVWQNYEQSFNPLIDTRDTDPFVYLSTAGGTGDLRAQIYDAGGSLIFDQYESDHPWRQTTDRYFAGMYVDGYSGICQMFSVHEDGRSWLGPERGFTGTPNWDSAADVHLFSLRHAGYYESGFLDDAVIANPDDGFVLEDFVDDLANGTWANGYARPERDGDFTVTDSSIESSNSSNRSFSTGAERLSWQAQPSISIASGTLLYSTDDGQTWQDANGGDALPETADGILLRRESMTLDTGVAYTGSDLTIPETPDVEVTPSEPDHDEEENTVTVSEQEGVIYDYPTPDITYEWAGTPHDSESIKRVDGVEVARNLAINPRFETGLHGWSGQNATLALSDGWDQMWGISDNQMVQADATGGSSYYAVRHDHIEIEPDKRIAVRALVADDRSPLETYIYMYGYDSSGSSTYQVSGDAVPSGWYPGNDLTHVFGGSESVATIRPTFAVQRGDGDTIPAGERMWVDRVHIAIADTEADALAQVETYFDGDTEDAVSIPEGGSVTVTAEPAAGYTFPSGATTSWTYEYLYPDPLSLAPILDVEIDQGELHTEQLDHQAAGPVWSVSSSDAISVSVDDGVLSVAASFVIGSTTATVTLADEYGREVSQSFGVTVGPRAWDAGEPPIYPHAPTILWDDESPQQVLLDPLEAVVTKEINGAETFELTLPATHEHAGLIRNERVIEVAGDRYWVRRITTERNGRTVDLQVYAEARFYELSVAGQIDAQEFTQVSAGYVMELAVAGTGWSVDVANVSTLRSYSVERTNPLELLREVASNHGGDLIFDNTNRRVSLVTTSGRDAGVSFFHGRGITEAKRVVDTTSLVTRIYAVNEDGLTIADINGGRSYVEDYSYTDEVREATYSFKSGTSPFTMLSMVNATLANRSRPDRSYELTVQDLSVETGQQMDRFDVGDLVTVADPEIGIDGETQRIVKLEYDLLEPWNTEITLSATLRELSSSSDSGDAGTLETGAGASTFDLVPFNLLLNSRFDNGLAHWAHHGAQVVETQQGTSDYAVRFAGSGERWIEQTFTPDNRSAYAVSFEMDTDGPTDWVPDLVVEAEITYQDGETETITLDLT